MSDAPDTMSQKLCYERDRDFLLEQRRRRSGQAFSTPAEVVHLVIRDLGYAIQETAELDPGVLACTDFELRVVWIALDFAERLDYPKSWREVYVSTLAHELGHIRLHAALTEQLAHHPQWEAEARLYSQIFLVPEDRLSRRLEVTCLKRTSERAQLLLWSYVLRLAEHFEVSGAFMVRTLVNYGLIDFDEERRVILPRHGPGSGPILLSAPVR